MSDFHIFYFRGGLLEATDDIASQDLVEAARVASSKYPHLTAEIWVDGKKGRGRTALPRASLYLLPSLILRSRDVRQPKFNKDSFAAAK